MKNLDLFDRIINSNPNGVYEFLVSKGYKIPFKQETVKKALMHYSNVNNGHKEEVLRFLHPDYNLILKCEKESVKKDKTNIKADGDESTKTQTTNPEKKEMIMNVVKGVAIIGGLVVLFKMME